uniref:Uncharacterized protein n=1 Tax=Pseudonocardia tetrahydrofuranoxydans TaxID=102884 RepID=Q9F3V1_9PSEU|nr:hypothetical protein [Pseudonocardia tetrahydrofuranoxydans]
MWEALSGWCVAPPHHPCSRAGQSSRRPESGAVVFGRLRGIGLMLSVH